MDVFSMLIIYYHSFIHAFVCSIPVHFPPHIISLIFMLMDEPGRWLWGFDDISPVEILGRLSPPARPSKNSCEIQQNNRRGGGWSDGGRDGGRDGGGLEGWICGS